jgi:hypothetical protein
MEISNISSMATDMKLAAAQTEASAKVMKMADDTTKQEGSELIKMMNASFTGLGQNFDRSI